MADRVCQAPGVLGSQVTPTPTDSPWYETPSALSSRHMGATRASHGLAREGQPRVESRQTPAHRAPPPTGSDACVGRPPVQKRFGFCTRHAGRGMDTPIQRFHTSPANHRRYTCQAGVRPLRLPRLIRAVAPTSVPRGNDQPLMMTATVTGIGLTF